MTHQRRLHAGRAGGRWRKLSADVRAQRQPCWLCGQHIDYELPPNHPMGFTVDHVVPRSLRPELAEEPGNLRAAHARCNKSRGTRAPKPGLGRRSTNW